MFVDWSLQTQLRGQSRGARAVSPLTVAALVAQNRVFLLGAIGVAALASDWKDFHAVLFRFCKSDDSAYHGLDLD